MVGLDTPGTWADLIPLVPGERVLLPSRLAGIGPRFTERGATTLPSPAAGVPDVIVADGPSDIADAVARLGDGGRLVIVAANRWSPLHRRRARHDRSSSPDGGLKATLRNLRSDARIAAVHPFALFPSVEAPTSAYRLDSSAIAELVLRSASMGAGRLRRLALALLSRTSRFGISWHVPPAWMVVAHIGRPPVELIPTGRIGVAANDQGVVLLGLGPDQIEKHYTDAAEADLVAAIHHELEEAGIELIVPVRGRPAPTRLRFDWVPGTDIDESNLADVEFSGWSARAAAVLGSIHGATRHEDGTVMTHGDYWLGALVARGTEVASVIDWTDGGRASPAVDIDVLTKAVRQRSTLDTGARRRLLDQMRQHYEAAGGPTALDAFD